MALRDVQGHDSGAVFMLRTASVQLQPKTKGVIMTAETMTVQQVADALEVTKQWAYMLVKSGKLKAEKVIDVNGRAVWLVDAESVQAYKESRMK